MRSMEFSALQKFKNINHPSLFVILIDLWAALQVDAFAWHGRGCKVFYD